MYRTKCHSHKPKKGKGSYNRIDLKQEPSNKFDLKQKTPEGAIQPGFSFMGTMYLDEEVQVLGYVRSASSSKHQHREEEELLI